jgi:hypothetical protein
MKAKHIFWGLLFVSLGVLILINNFSGLNWDWIGLWKLWPLLFILWGIGIMIKNNTVKIIIAGLAGFALAVTLFSSFKSVVQLTTGDFNVVFDDDAQDYKYDFTDYSEPYSKDIESAEFHFKAGAGTFYSINDTTTRLFYAHAEGVKDNYDLTSIISSKNAVIKMKMEGSHFRIGNSNTRNRVGMNFNPSPEWDLNFEVGASSVNLDLTTIKVKTLKVGMGAASLKVKLGGILNRSDVNIEAGASKVVINVPENVGCEIKMDGALNSKEFDGFKKLKSDLYQTANFDSTKKKIYIKIDSGVSSLDINRYSGDW